jgi:hypothetical protein
METSNGKHQKKQFEDGHLLAVASNVAQVFKGLLIHRQQVTAKAAGKGQAGARHNACLHNGVLLQTTVTDFQMPSTSKIELQN